MTLFTSLGPSADCRGLTQVPTYRERTGHARGAAFSVSQRGFSLGWGLQGKVARTPHQSKGSGGTVWGGSLTHGIFDRRSKRTVAVAEQDGNGLIRGVHHTIIRHREILVAISVQISHYD